MAKPNHGERLQTIIRDADRLLALAREAENGGMLVYLLGQVIDEARSLEDAAEEQPSSASSSVVPLVPRR